MCYVLTCNPSLCHDLQNTYLIPFILYRRSGICKYTEFTAFSIPTVISFLDQATLQVVISQKIEADLKVEWRFQHERNISSVPQWFSTATKSGFKDLTFFFFFFFIFHDIFKRLFCQVKLCRFKKAKVNEYNNPHYERNIVL